MADVVIQAEDLGKMYVIGHQEEGGYVALRDVVAQNAKGLWRKTRDLVQGKPIVQGTSLEDVWALKEVNFQLPRGDAVGIIGRNGAGKSTLLKILSRITEPSVGRVTIKGRVASLLEVGTGFHPELTGRENVYLNGAVLGMARAEITRKFDEIVAFAEVEKFLDTPVKRYSSGMYVRLAFAVAAHLEPEILVVDEVLAVGDAAFQRKCLGKMGDVASQGRTVLFVSHSMPAVLSLCSHALWFDKGRLVREGAVEPVVSEYLKSGAEGIAISLDSRTDRAGDGSLRLTGLQIDSVASAATIRCGDRLRIALTYNAMRSLSGVNVVIGVYDELNRPIFLLDSDMAGPLPDGLPATGTITCTTAPIGIAPGYCTVNVAVYVRGVLADHIKQAAAFDIEADDYYGTGRLTSRKQALCLLGQEWQFEVDALPHWSEIKDLQHLSNP